MKRIPQPFGRKVWGYRSSDEEIQGSVWHFPFPSVEESKTTAGRTRHRNRYIDGNKPSRPLRIAAKSAVEESGSFLEQDSTAVPKFAFRSFCPCGNLVGECLPQTLLMRLAPLKNPSKYFFGFFKNSSASHPVFLLLVRGHHAQKGGQPPMKRYNTPHRSRVVKTRMTEEEYAEFAQRLSAYHMSQAEFIRQAITGAAIRPS